MTALSAQLHPDRFTQIGGKIAAIVAYVLGLERTAPAHVDDRRPGAERPDYAERLH